MVFALYLEFATKELKEFIRTSNGSIIYYADDIVIMIDNKYVSKIFKYINELEESWNMVVNKDKSDYIVLGKNAKNTVVNGLGNKAIELKYLGVQISKRIIKSTKVRLDKYIKSRITAFQKRIYFMLDKSTRLGVFWYEVAKLLFTTYSD